MPAGREDPLTVALARLRTVTFGGFVTTHETIARLLSPQASPTCKPYRVRRARSPRWWSRDGRRWTPANLSRKSLRAGT
jgi:hypothetical protein